MIPIPPDDQCLRTVVRVDFSPLRQFLPVFSRFADMGPQGLESTSVSLLYAMLQTSRAMNKVGTGQD